MCMCVCVYVVAVLLVLLCCCVAGAGRAVGMNTVQSVTFIERPAYYREKQSDMYAPLLYVASNTLVEVVYITLSSLFFTLPFFFIVGLDDGDVSVRFLWYWVFMGLLLCSMVFAGQFFSVLLPNEAAAGGET